MTQRQIIIVRAVLTLVIALMVAPLVSSQTVTRSDGAVKIRCAPPTQDTAGKPLTDLIGYNVYFKRPSRSTYGEMVPSSICGYDFSGMGDGTWSFRVSAISKSLGESDPSEAVDVIFKRATAPVPPPPPPPNPCVTDPLTLTVRGWPGDSTGSRSLQYVTDKPITRLSLEWPLRVTVADARGCQATVVR